MKEHPEFTEYELFATAIEQWGEESQIKMAIEEMAELTKALCKRWRGGSDEDVIDEIVDVGIMLEQMRLVFGPGKVDARRAVKLKRLQERLAP